MTLDRVVYFLWQLALIVELVIVGVNSIPKTKKQWREKKHAVIRRVALYVALTLAVMWLASL